MLCVLSDRMVSTSVTSTALRADRSGWVVLNALVVSQILSNVFTPSGDITTVPTIRMSQYRVLRTFRVQTPVSTAACLFCSVSYSQARITVKRDSTLLHSPPLSSTPFSSQFSASLMLWLSAVLCPVLNVKSRRLWSWKCDVISEILLRQSMHVYQCQSTSLNSANAVLTLAYVLVHGRF